MIFSDWLDRHCPHWREQSGPEIQVRHVSGEVSSLWLRDGREPLPVGLDAVSDFYALFDGADLFSSTFKVCALRQPKVRTGVEIVPALDEFARDVKAAGCTFPEEAVPFMVQAGIGIYAVARGHSLIYEWDTETHALSGTYRGLTDILDEWLAAVG